MHTQVGQGTQRAPQPVWGINGALSCTCRSEEYCIQCLVLARRHSFGRCLDHHCGLSGTVAQKPGTAIMSRFYRDLSRDRTKAIPAASPTSLGRRSHFCCMPLAGLTSCELSYQTCLTFLLPSLCLVGVVLAYMHRNHLEPGCDAKETTPSTQIISVSLVSISIKKTGKDKLIDVVLNES